MNKITSEMQKELNALANQTDSDIDFSGIPKTNEKDWVEAERGKFYRPVKKQLTVRMDADVLAWLKEQGKGYQTRMNIILREAMQKDHLGL